MTQIQHAADAAVSSEDLQEVARAFRALTHAIHAFTIALGENDLAKTTTSPSVSQNIIEDIQQDIVRCHGPFVHGRDLARLLGYTPAQFRATARRGDSPVPVSRIPGRPGYQASARDIAIWLAALRERALREMDEER